MVAVLLVVVMCVFLLVSVYVCVCVRARVCKSGESGKEKEKGTSRYATTQPTTCSLLHSSCTLRVHHLSPHTIHHTPYIGSMHIQPYCAPPFTTQHTSHTIHKQHAHTLSGVRTTHLTTQ